MGCQTWRYIHRLFILFACVRWMCVCVQIWCIQVAFGNSKKKWNVINISKENVCFPKRLKSLMQFHSHREKNLAQICWIPKWHPLLHWSMMASYAHASTQSDTMSHLFSWLKWHFLYTSYQFHLAFSLCVLIQCQIGPKSMLL